MQIRDASSEPLYSELADTLRNAIAAGTYAAGSKLPSEAELQADTGLSRSTVRKALELLVKEGLVVKERGRGAFVASTPQAPTIGLTFASFTAQAERRGQSVRTRTVDAKRALPPQAVAEFLNLQSGTEAVEIVRLRYLDEKPLCIESSYFSPAFVSLIDENLDRSLYEVLRERFGKLPARGHKTFEICFARQNEAFLLDVPRETPLMLITDFVYDTDDAPLHVSKRVVRTDEVKYVELIG